MRQHQDGREGGDEYRAGETRLCACVQERASEREGRERVNGWRREESAEKGREGRFGGGGGGSAARQRQMIMSTKLRTYQRRASQRYRKEDQIGTRVHSGEQRDDSCER